MKQGANGLLPITCALALALAAAGPARASLDDQAVYSVCAGGKILKLDFANGTSTVVNTDAGLRREFGSLVVRDDLRDIHLVVADRAGKILFYSGAGGAGQVVTSQIASPTGLSLDADGNLFLVSQPKPSILMTRPRLWMIPRGGPRPGDYGSPVAIGVLPPRMWAVATKVVPTSDGRLREGDILVLAAAPARLLRYRKTAAGFAADVFIEQRLFPAGSRPTGLALSPRGEILVATLGGAVLRFDDHGRRLTPDFASTGVALRGISIGIQERLPRVFLTTDSAVLRFDLMPNGVGQLGGSVTQGVSRATGTGIATERSVPTRAGAQLRVRPHPDSEVTFDSVGAFGLTTAHMFEFADNRAGAVDQGLRDFFPADPKLQGRLPDVTVPAYVQAFPKKLPGDPSGGPYTGPPTFVLTVVDTTAPFSRTAQVHIEESSILGYQPSCTDPDPGLRPRTFHAAETDPPKSEPQVVEGPVFADVSTGCGSNIGRGSNFSLWLTARDTRAPGAIVTAKLDGLDAALLAHSALIDSATLATLQAAAGDCRAQFGAGDKRAAIRALDDLMDAVDASPGAFTPDAVNVPGELIRRAHSIAYMIGETLNLSPIDIMVGDDDGYGRGIEDEDSLRQGGKQPFDARSAAEIGASDGSEQTDVYSALVSPLDPSSFDVTFNLPGRLYRGRLTIDMGSFEGTAFGFPIGFAFNGLDQPAMVFDDGEEVTRVRHFELAPAAIARANLAGKLILTVKRTIPNVGDLVCFDYFRLQGLVGP
jgi:hypothetical protein